jgi:hypothetical protein
MNQAAVEGLSKVCAQMTDDIDETQLVAAQELIEAIVHPLGPDDIRSLMSLMPENGDTVRIPEYPPTDSDNMRPLVPEHPPTCDALP